MSKLSNYKLHFEDIHPRHELHLLEHAQVAWDKISKRLNKLIGRKYEIQSTTRITRS